MVGSVVWLHILLGPYLCVCVCVCVRNEKKIVALYFLYCMLLATDFLEYIWKLISQWDFVIYE